jgi:hypothetical protein
MAACTARLQPEPCTDAVHSHVAGTWPQPKFSWASSVPAAPVPGSKGRGPQEEELLRPSKQARVAAEHRTAPQQQAQHQLGQEQPAEQQCSGAQLASALLEAAPVGSIQQLAFLACFWCGYLQACAALFSCCCSTAGAQQEAELGWAAGSSAADVQRVDAAFVPGSLLGVLR